MPAIRERTIEAGGGWLVEVDVGQTLLLRTSGAVELYGYNRADRAEWIDVARTRVYNLNIFHASATGCFPSKTIP